LTEAVQEIPARLECAYCIRNQCHGGECKKQHHFDYNEKNCLVFKMDPRGCIREGNTTISIPLYENIPPLNVWSDDWVLCDVETAIRILEIKALNWNAKKGCLVIHCRFEYYINEYHPDYSKKAMLKLVKS